LETAIANNYIQRKYQLTLKSFVCPFFPPKVVQPVKLRLKFKPQHPNGGFNPSSGMLCLTSPARLYFLVLTECLWKRSQLIHQSS
jgi:hypothetical protein